MICFCSPATSPGKTILLKGVKAIYSEVLSFLIPTLYVAFEIIESACLISHSRKNVMSEIVRELGGDSVKSNYSGTPQYDQQRAMNFAVL